MLADFILGCSFNKEKKFRELNQNIKGNEGRAKGDNKDNHMYLWTLYVNGAAMPNQNGGGAILEGPNGLFVSYVLRFNFPVTNNMVKYEALINGM